MDQSKARGHGRRSKRSPVGAAPGTLIADPQAPQPVLRATVISPQGSATFDAVSLEQVRTLRDTWPVLWLDCVGLGNVELIGDLGTMFGLHRLALEDVVNTGQRPKTDFFDDHAFIVLRMIDAGNEPEQISLFVGAGYVLTFQERQGDCFDPVRQRIEAGGRLWSRGSDYLAYALIDAVVDGYFPLLDKKGDQIDRIEDTMISQTEKSQAALLHRLRREMILLKRWLWPVRDAVGALMRSEAGYIAAETRLYLADTYDHTVRLIEIAETYRDTLTGLIEMHLALLQARTNEVVNLLTIVSTIFIPLTFLAGIWGMNFDPDSSPWNMPELGSYFGYPVALGTMALIGTLLVIYFRWKKWL